MSLVGKVALVTGSTSGIGLGIARALAKEGCAVMIHGLLDARASNQLVENLKSEFQVPVGFSGANIGRPEEISQMLHETVRILGPIEILVNNAGIQHVAPLDSFPPEKWDSILAINLTSVFYTTRGFIRNAAS